MKLTRPTMIAVGAAVSIALTATAASAAGPETAPARSETTIVDTTIGLPVSVPSTLAAVATPAAVQRHADARAAHLTRHLSVAELELLVSPGPRTMTWDLDEDAIISVEDRGRADLDPFTLAPGLGCTDNAAHTSCIHRTGGTNRSLTGRNTSSNPSWSSINSTLYAGPRSIRSELCAGSTSSGNCMAVPPDHFVDFRRAETIYRVTHH